jgi:hypothetical protein
MSILSARTIGITRNVQASIWAGDGSGFLVGVLSRAPTGASTRSHPDSDGDCCEILLEGPGALVDAISGFCAPLVWRVLFGLVDFGVSNMQEVDSWEPSRQVVCGPWDALLNPASIQPVTT